VTHLRPVPSGDDTDSGIQSRGDLDSLFSVTYEELRRLASSVRRNDPAATLSPTTLVSEAWLKLARSPMMAGVTPVHFKRIAARAMRQVLIEAARRRHATKRGNAEPLVTFDDSVAASVSCAEDLLTLDEVLDELARLNPRQAAIVESRFFGGFDVASIAEALGVSEATVLRDWRSARAWLALELRRER
jgi:RNA polymerase sigma factor (TIGR02999 family)